jgi:hypothetical protein
MKSISKTSIGPVYTHDCESCMHLATENIQVSFEEPRSALADVYLCPGTDKSDPKWCSVIVRTGNDGPNYHSTSVHDLLTTGSSLIWSNVRRILYEHGILQINTDKIKVFRHPSLWEKFKPEND